MPIATGLSVASITTGWISFGLTILTWLGVYITLILTIRGAPQQIPLALSNLREELLAERSLLKHRIREGDRYGVFPGRQVRRIGKNESQLRLMEITLNTTWKEFKALEQRFIVKGDQRGMGEVEDTWSNVDSESSDDNKEKWNDEKGGLKNRINGGRRMRRRQSRLKTRMGYCEAGLSQDRQTYYNTDFRHRVLWWWKRDDVSRLNAQVQRIQIRRMDCDLFETDELVKRGLWVLGAMSGENVLHNLGPPYTKNGSGLRRKRSHGARSKRASSRSLNNQGSRSVSRARGRGDGVREVYEKEIRRVRRRSSSRGSVTASPSPPAKVAGSTFSRSRNEESERRSRAPSVVEYEVVNPGRIWVDVEPSQSNLGRAPEGRRMSRPQPAHFQSYVRERGDGPSR